MDMGGENQQQRRRQFIASLSILVAGVLTGRTSWSDRANAGNEDVGNDDTPAEIDMSQDDGETDSPTETEVPYTDLSVGDASVVTIDTGYSQDVGVEVPVTNTGEAMTGRFTVGVDWYDADDEYIATSDLYGRALDAGETWLTRTAAWLDVDEPGQIERAEATITDDSGDPIDAFPSRIELASEDFNASEQDVTLRGVLTNNRSTSEFLYVAGKVYDADEVVIANDWTIEEVEAGDSWRFELTPNTWGRNGQAESGTIVPYIDD